MSASIRIIIHLLCALPLLWLLYLAYEGDLGANPIEYITRYTGDWAIRFILITLTVSPLARITRKPVFLQYRRAVGLWAFFYALCHFTIYITIDQFFDWESIVEDIAKRPYILVGFTAFVLLIPLAATSNRWAIRAMRHHWNTLHKLVYVIAITGLLHYWWLVRADFLKAWVYLAILALLLGYRLAIHLTKPRY